MNLKVTISGLLSLLVILVVLPLMTYDAEAKELTLDTISRETDYSGSQDSNPRIQILSSRPAMDIAGVTPEDSSLIQSVDYSRYFVMIAFFGYGSSSSSSVLDIWQYKSVFWVKSNISKDEKQPTEISPYQVIKIDKAEMVRYGKITFRFLNQFEEKSKTIQVIAAIGNPA
jgi:hypothetical protein